jgi:hypothetical protein
VPRISDLVLLAWGRKSDLHHGEPAHWSAQLPAQLRVGSPIKPSSADALHLVTDDRRRGEKVNRRSNTETLNTTGLYKTRGSRQTASWPAPRSRGTDPHLSTRLLKAVPGNPAENQPDMAPTTNSLHNGILDRHCYTPEHNGLPTVG